MSALVDTPQLGSANSLWGLQSPPWPLAAGPAFAVAPRGGQCWHLGGSDPRHSLSTWAGLGAPDRTLGGTIGCSGLGPRGPSKTSLTDTVNVIPL